ncbi:hypothetical protein SDC9_132673 [bioreactor metagenome]|uniref:Uncharacterized protein n=1 Tax=bioreactor metagenome TaxID=1076179 RepID=A0A645DAF4_9ZZZZ
MTDPAAGHLGLTAGEVRQILDDLLELLTVLTALDRGHRGPDQFDAVPLQGARLVQRDRGVQGGLATQSRQQRVGALSGDDLLHVLGSDRFQVGGIRELGIGHDGRRVRIDQNDPVALFPQHPAGLGAGVVEFGGLADDDRSRADHHDRADVCAPRHQ